MKATGDAARLLGGSFIVYIVMAACSAGQGTGYRAIPGDDGSGSPDGSGGLVDSLTDPVSSAEGSPSQSGTRLKLQYYVGTDGSQLAAGMFDSQLNVQCYFGKASDGKIRCLPFPTPTVLIGTQNFYVDAMCSQVLGVAYNAKCAAPSVIDVPNTNNCTTSDTLYRVGAQFTGALYQSSSTGCAALDANSQKALVGAGYTFYELGSQIQPPDPSQYVEATLQTQQ